MASLDCKYIDRDRLNPEFIGISQQLHETKRQRLTIQHRRDHLNNNLLYKIKVHNSLENKLLQNKMKLGSVEGVHDRRTSDIEYRNWRQSEQKMRIKELNRNAKESRNQNKINIRTAILKSHAYKAKKRQMIGKMLESYNQQLTQSKQYNLQQNKIKYKQIKASFDEGKRTVNHFHRNKNLESLNTYKGMIQHELTLTDNYQQEIRNIEESIDTYDHKIQRKKQYLLSVLDNIHHYNNEPLQSQTRCLPLYLRDHSLATSYHSSKPSDIILNGFKHVLHQSSLTTETK